MARSDITIQDHSGYNCLPTQNWGVASGTPVTVKQGEPTKFTTLPNVYLCEDGDLTLGTDTRFTGVAQSDSTETASAAGSVETYVPLTGIIYRMKAKTASTFDGLSEIVALKGARVLLDLTTSTFTLDVAATTAGTNAFTIVGGNATEAMAYFTIVNDATYLGWNA